MSTKPTFRSDRIEAEWRGDQITIWNHLTVVQQHELGHGLHESHHKVLAGDGSTGEKPEFITPEMDDKLHAIDVYPNVRIINLYFKSHRHQQTSFEVLILSLYVARFFNTYMTTSTRDDNRRPSSPA